MSGGVILDADQIPVGISKSFVKLPREDQVFGLIVLQGPFQLYIKNLRLFRVRTCFAWPTFTSRTKRFSRSATSLPSGTWPSSTCTTTAWRGWRDWNRCRTYRCSTCRGTKSKRSPDSRISPNWRNCTSRETGLLWWKDWACSQASKVTKTVKTHRRRN